MAAPAGYVQVFSDDFNTLSVSANKTANANWYSGQAWGGGFGDAKFVSAASPNSPFSIVQQGGESALRIHMTRDANGQLQSGLISNTFPDGTSTTVRDGNPYGYYEARMWLPTGQGIWPGFWSLESERLSPTRDHVIEVDVMENYGTAIPTQYSSVVHDWDWNGKTLEGHTAQYARATPGAGVVSSGWHTYGVQITPEKMTFYFDDKAYWSIPTPAGLNTDPMFMIDLAAGAGWPIDPNLKDVSLYVDYFRSYELQATKPVPVVPPSLIVTSVGAVTAKALQVVSGTTDAALAGKTVSILDGTAVIGTAKVGADGSFSLKVTLGGEGRHALVASVTDGQGVTGTSKAVAYVLDTVAPVAPGLDLTGFAGKAMKAPLLTGVAEAGATVTLYDGKAVIATVTADAATGAFSFGALSDLSAGNHTLVARATDAAGNVSKASLAQTVTVGADGSTTAMTAVQADGTKDIYRLAITGKDYTTEHNAYNAKGALTDTSRYYSDGTLSYHYNLDGATGTKTTDTFDTSGKLTSHAVALVDGSLDTIVYGPGTLVTETNQHADRSKDVYRSGITDQSYIAEHYFVGTNGAVVYSDQTNIDLSHTQTAKKSGVTLTSTEGVSDLFKSAGGDSFVFASGFGKDTVTGFRADSGPLHDVLVLDASQVGSFAELQAHHMISAVGKDALITLSPTDSILLKNVAVAQLTADDFKFQDHGLFHA
jgi:hypothetical protein